MVQVDDNAPLIIKIKIEIEMVLIPVYNGPSGHNAPCVIKIYVNPLASGSKV